MIHKSLSHIAARLLFLPLCFLPGCNSATDDATVGENPAAGQQTMTAQDVTAQQLAERIEQGDAPLVLDVRSEEEFAAGRVPGAVNVPHDQLAARIDELPIEPSGEVVVYCQRGGRAERAENMLLEAGFTKVLDLTGHYQEWENQDLPAEDGEKE